MKNQKFLITDNEKDVEHWVDRGWEIVSVTAQHVSLAGAQRYSERLKGKFAIVLEKTPYTT